VLLGTFAAVAVGLAAAGIYGVMALVTARTRARAADGARREASGRVRAGAAPSCDPDRRRADARLRWAVAATRYLETLLFGLTPLDPGTFVAVVLFFATVAACASLVPAVAPHASTRSPPCAMNRPAAAATRRSAGASARTGPRGHDIDGVVRAGCARDSVRAAQPRRGFLDRLQRAVDARDRRAVAALFQYPATILSSGFNVPLADAATLTRIYDAAFTPDVRCAIADSRIAAPGTAAPEHPAVVSADGIMIGAGAGIVWAPFKNGRYQIARIRVPPPSLSQPARRLPERVQFVDTKGTRTGQAAGWLARQNVETFLVDLKAGESLDARIEGFRGHDATIRVLAPDQRAAVNTAVPDAGRSWTGKASTPGQYRVDVIHLAPYCDPPQRYRLFLTIR
jgi:hypothetical protein